MGGGPALSAKSAGRHGALSGPHGAVSGPHGAVSGPQRMLSAEPSMRDLEGGFSTALLISKSLFALKWYTCTALRYSKHNGSKNVIAHDAKAITAEDAEWYYFEHWTAICTCS